MRPSPGCVGGEDPALVRAGRLVAAGTMASRITGFIRTLVLAGALGLGTRLFDAYSVANNVPNIVFDLVIGGVLTSVAVPLLVRAHLSDRDAGEAYDAKLLATVFYLLSLAVAASVLAAPLIVDIYASGFTTSEHHVAVTLTRFFLPQVLFYGLGSTMAAIINAQGRFGLPAWAPVANNVIVTAAALMYILVGGTGSVTAISTSELVVLGLGTTLGIAAQAAILAPSLRRRGGGWLRAFDPRRLGDRHAMLRALRLAGWVSLYALANQVSLIIVTRLSTGAGEGSFGTFTNAYTLFQLPYAVVAVSIITTLAPRISRHAATGNQVRLTADISRAMRTACCILLPTTVLFLLLGPALATVLFAHGHATSSAVHATGSVLVIFGLAVLPFSAFQIMVAFFYAFRDSRTPAIVNLAADAIGVIVFIAAALALPARDRDLGLAVGYLVSYTFGVVAFTYLLRQRLGRLDGRRVLRTFTRLSIAATLAGGVGLSARLLVAKSGTGSWPGASVVIATVLLTGGTSFLWLARRMRITELRALLTLPGRR
jgi:putative peptidoglycan lipid II flippase